MVFSGKTVANTIWSACVIIFGPDQSDNASLNNSNNSNNTAAGTVISPAATFAAVALVNIIFRNRERRRRYYFYGRAIRVFEASVNSVSSPSSLLARDKSCADFWQPVSNPCPASARGFFSPSFPAEALRVRAYGIAAAPWSFS